MRGLALTLDTGKLHVSGRLLRWDDWRKIAENARGFPPDSFIFSAQIDDDVLNEAKAGLRAVVRDAGMTDLEFRFTPSVSVQVSPTPADLKERTVAVLKGFGIPVRESAEAVHLAPLVRVRIVVAEVRKSAMTKIGISWQDSLGGQLLPTKAWEPFSARLHAMEATGESKILASPTLLCRSGKEAHFLAGGEFPIKVSSLKSHELVWKKHGVVLNIKPQADLSGRMSIGIETEVSMLDTSRTIEGLPGLLTNRIETHFDLTSSRTIALSGLIKKEWGQARQGLPGLGALPILGPLFSSRDYIDSLTELVVFVTPEVVDTEKGN
jgi:pilus assembly protein CpaC